MTPGDERLAAQAALYDRALDTPVTTAAIDFLCRSQMLLRITEDQLDPALEVVHSDAGHAAARREWDQLSEDERIEVARVAAQQWDLNLNLAVRRMFHAANVLGFKGDSLDPKHVAIVAATYFSRSPDDVYAELEKSAK
jgi:hypothetical protein